jgi:hypothetical protein
MAKPTTSTIYQFTTDDIYKCSTFKGSINVEVGKIPVSKSETINVLTGDNVQLSSFSSSEFVTYNWVPAIYLGCTDCAEPDCKPLSDMRYGVTVSTKYGCIATDSMFVHLGCGESIFIPSAFVPNGLSKLFYPMGKGVQKVNYFRVFNRMGQIVFERNNFHLTDANIGWNGDVNGKVAASAGTYVYDLEAICDTGEVFHKNGTVVLIR